MPGFLKHLTHTSYGFVDPYVEKARNMVPLLDSTVQRIEPYFPPVIDAADQYIDAAQNTAGLQVAILKGRKDYWQDKVSGFQENAGAKLQQLCGSVHASAVVLMDRSDAFVDRLLPPDEAEEKSELEIKSSGALVSRAVHIPFKIPLRCTRIVFVKAGGLSEAVILRSSEEKRRFVNIIAQGSHSISNKVVSVTAPGRAILSAGQASFSRKMQVAYQSLVDAEEVVVVWVGGRVYLVATYVRLPEIQHWTLAKVAEVKQVTATATTRATQGAYATTTRIAGNERAEIMFHKLGLCVPSENKPESAWERVQEEAQEIVDEAMHVPAVHKPESAWERVQEEAQEIVDEAMHVPAAHKPETLSQRVQEETQEIIEEARSVTAKCA